MPTDTGGLSRCHRHDEIAAGKIVWARRAALPGGSAVIAETLSRSCRCVA